MSRPRRPTSPLHVIETYAPDPERCARALLRLLDGGAPAPSPQAEDSTGISSAVAHGSGHDTTSPQAQEPTP